MSQDTNQRGKKRSKRWTLRLDGHTGDQTAAICLIDQTQVSTEPRFVNGKFTTDSWKEKSRWWVWMRPLLLLARSPVADHDE